MTTNMLACVRGMHLKEIAALGDGVEVSPVREIDGADVVERCEATEADYWAVYIHLCAGGVEWVADWVSESYATAHAGQLVTAHPQLAKYGVYRT